MAGKLHKDYDRYISGGGQIPSVGGARAYAEGYNFRRGGGLQAGNPHGAVVSGRDDDARAWDQGWRDGDAHKPPTHVGGPATFTVLERSKQKKEATGAKGEKEDFAPVAITGRKL